MTDQSTPTIIENIDEIVFRCFDQGVYWGKLAYSDNERPDEPENPIDRTEANKLLMKLLADFAERITPEKEIYSVSKKMADKRFEEIGVLPAPHSAYRLGRTDVIDTITQNVKAELGAAPTNSKEVSNE